jgi:hypothetical protein
LLALSACQTVFGIDETGLNETAGSGTASASVNSGGATGSGAAAGTSGSTGGHGDGASGGYMTGSAGAGGDAGAANPGDCGMVVMGTDLLTEDGGVESGIAAGDAGWNEWASTLAVETENVHSGTQAALLCAITNNQELFTAFIDVPGANPMPGDQFVASACVRSHPGHTPPEKASMAVKEQTTSNGVYPIEGPELSTIDSTWRRIETPPLTVTDDPDTYLITAHVMGWHPTDDVCLVFDDVRVVKLP